MDDTLLTPRGKDLDIHHIGIRLMAVFQGIDNKFRGTQLTNVTQCPGVPSDVPLPFIYSQLPCTEYFVFSSETAFQPDVDSFFIPAVLPLIPDKTDRENIYWQLRLMHGCGLLSIGLMQLSRLLQRVANGGHAYFVAFFQNSEDGEGEVTKEKIFFEDIALRSLDYEPRAIHIVRRDFGFKVRSTEKVELIFGPNVASHNLLVCRDQWIFDMAGMMFKMRGLQDELVGRLEPIQSYLNRFPGSEIPTLDETNEYLDSPLVHTLFKMNEKYIQDIVMIVLDDILENRRWCNYCGKIVDVPSTCAGCKSPAVNYCERWCQKADWKGHRLFCGKPVVTVENVSADGGRGVSDLAQEILREDLARHAARQTAENQSKNEAGGSKEQYFEDVYGVLGAIMEDDAEDDDGGAAGGAPKPKITAKKDNVNISPKNEKTMNEEIGGDDGDTEKFKEGPGLGYGDH